MWWSFTSNQAQWISSSLRRATEWLFPYRVRILRQRYFIFALCFCIFVFVLYKGGKFPHLLLLFLCVLLELFSNSICLLVSLVSWLGEDYYKPCDVSDYLAIDCRFLFSRALYMLDYRIVEESNQFSHYQVSIYVILIQFR